MRKWLLIAVAFALVFLAGTVLWSSLGVRSPPSPAPASRALPEFESVEVSSGASEGLALTGRVLEPTGRPVADAEVFLASSAQKTLTSVRCDECGQALLACPARESGMHVWDFFEQARGFLQSKASTRTDAQGRFRFAHLSGVSFTVWVRAAGLGTALREHAAPGEPVDLYLSPLRRISGQVVDDAGRGLPGAQVYAVSRKVPLPAEAVTGPEGAFTLEGLGEGPFYVVASAKGFLPSLKLQVEAGVSPRPVRLWLESARTLEVRVTHGGQPVEATVRLHAAHLDREAHAEHGTARFEQLYPEMFMVSAEAGALGAVPRPLTLSERVTRVTLEVEEAGSLLITVVDETGQPVPSPRLVLRPVWSPHPIQAQKPAPGTLVRFGPLAVGDYELEGQAPGFLDARLPAHVKPGERTLELEMTRATLITGQVLDLYGRPAPNASVGVMPTDDAVLADEAGRFSVPVPTPGLYELYAHHSEWGGRQVKATAPADGVKLELEPRADLEVTVMSEGRRVEGADVSLWIGRLKTGHFRSASSSGSDGVVPMRGLPAGTYSLVATHPDYLSSHIQTVEVVDGQTRRVTVSLEPDPVLSGQVVDAQGAPVPGASVSVSGLVVTTNTQGHFEVRGLEARHVYLVEARHPGYDQRGRTQASPGGEPVRVEMEARAVFRGRVVAEDDEPVRQFRLDEHEVTSADGRFELTLASKENRVTVFLEAKGYVPLRVEKPATSNELGDLVMQRSAMMKGQVRDEGGAPVADAVVGCYACDDSVMTGADGSFTLLTPDREKFNVSARKGRLSASALVSSGENRPLELVLKRATRLSGTVYRANGSPAAGIQVIGANLTGDSRQAYHWPGPDYSSILRIVTGPDGHYSLDLAPGTYRFMVEDEEFSDEPAIPYTTVQVGGDEQQVNLGPAPGTVPLTVRRQPE